jgi:chromosome partitioning protein
LKIVTVGTLKGGTGKTATLFNLAGLLAENYKILLIDCDPQTNLSLNCGVDITVKNLHTIIDIFENSSLAKAENIIFRNPIKELQNIDLIPSSIKLTSTELQIVSRAGRENILKNFISANTQVLSEYDYILIDTNPSMGIINQNAFLVADSIILISDVSLNGIQGAELFIELWADTRRNLNKEDNIKALILNNLDRRIKLSAELIEYCNDNDITKEIILKTVIPSSVQIKNTEIEHRTINCLYKNSQIHESYKKILIELKERGIA